jgi:hypothetical protein
VTGADTDGALDALALIEAVPGGDAHARRVLLDTADLRDSISGRP